LLTVFHRPIIEYNVCSCGLHVDVNDSCFQ